ncbi:FadR/GntR family transcriptional regulator [Amnibacterium kyonggiense]|uniref:GntR family transcriptional regulator n=1 Tax=Amnibacterium kyonggiense TaxID=595671 RepID=A0A4R7FR06_9MICO|nr:FCD domain-containing protein [Amnibacterium kyonggiense]TDS80245.1 GntR family transcriptional regulator [Amnibacterium kyonggiense]
MTSGGSAYGLVLERVGAAIVSGSWAAGRIATVDALVAETGVSRTIVREVTRELVAAGLLSASPRIGLRVLPRESWDLLDRRVVRWRLRVGDREQQLRELRELRAAVEPEAAALAAAAGAPAGDLVRAAAVLDAARSTADGSAFLAADTGFYHVLLDASGNAMLRGLGALVDAALEDRALVALHGRVASAEDVALHAEVAAAVAACAPERARTAMRAIVDRAVG